MKPHGISSGIRWCEGIRSGVYGIIVAGWKGGRALELQLKNSGMIQESREDAQERDIQNLRGTMAVEGMVLSNSSQKNIRRIFNGSASVQMVIQELNKKYLRVKA